MCEKIANNNELLPNLQSLCLFALAEPRQPPNRRARFRFRQSQFVYFLQVQSEFRTGAEKMRQPQGAVAGNGPLAVQDSGNPVGRDLEPPAELGGAHAEFLELLGEVFSGMDSGACHALFPYRDPAGFHRVLDLTVRSPFRYDSKLFLSRVSKVISFGCTKSFSLPKVCSCSTPMETSALR